jgi:hypothetical protein
VDWASGAPAAFCDRAYDPERRASEGCADRLRPGGARPGSATSAATGTRVAAVPPVRRWLTHGDGCRARARLLDGVPLCRHRPVDGVQAPSGCLAGRSPCARGRSVRVRPTGQPRIDVNEAARTGHDPTSGAGGIHRRRNSAPNPRCQQMAALGLFRRLLLWLPAVLSLLRPNHLRQCLKPLGRCHTAACQRR